MYGPSQQLSQHVSCCQCVTRVCFLDAVTQKTATMVVVRPAKAWKICTAGHHRKYVNYHHQLPVKALPGRWSTPGHRSWGRSRQTGCRAMCAVLAARAASPESARRPLRGQAGVRPRNRSWPAAPCRSASCRTGLKHTQARSSQGQQHAKSLQRLAKSRYGEENCRPMVSIDATRRSGSP
jgi:hypothetical protein